MPALQIRMSRRECVKIFRPAWIEENEIRSSSRKVSPTEGAALLAGVISFEAASALRPVKQMCAGFVFARARIEAEPKPAVPGVQFSLWDEG